jgi:HEPN domain-containing protein
MNNRDIAKEWFHIADFDLHSAEFLTNMNPMPVEIICYHCQQSAEKYLKGFLALHGEEIHKTHDLIRLNRLCLKYSDTFLEITEDCLNVTDYGVNVRYPFPMELNESDARSALQSAQRIKQFILSTVDLGKSQNI